MIEEVTLDFVVANDREPRDKQELAEWCKVPVLALETEHLARLGNAKHQARQFGVTVPFRLIAKGKRAMLASVKLITALTLGMDCSRCFPGEAQLSIGFADKGDMARYPQNASVFGAFGPNSVPTPLTAFPQIMLKQQLAAFGPTIA
jgi:hypothetical protein